jgi:hypothetical protein
VRGHTNILKRLVVHAGGFNLQGRLAAVMTIVVGLWRLVDDLWRAGTERSDHRRFTVTRRHHFELLPVSLSDRHFATGC